MSTRSGPETYPRIDVAGRRDDFKLGEMEDATVVQPGVTAYDYGTSVMRWGDYNGISVDPETDHYWCVSQYSPAETAFPIDSYATRIAEVFF